LYFVCSSGGTLCRIQCLRLRAVGLVVFLNWTPARRLPVSLSQRLTGHGQLRAGLAKPVDFRCLAIQSRSLFECPDITRQRFARCLDGFKRAGRLVNSLE
jgi:hypothetical protein